MPESVINKLLAIVNTPTNSRCRSLHLSQKCLRKSVCPLDHPSTLVSPDNVAGYILFVMQHTRMHIRDYTDIG